MAGPEKMETSNRLGVVVGSNRGKYWTEITALLTYQDLEKGSRPLLGEFIKITFGEKAYIGVVLDVSDTSLGDANPTVTLALAHLERADLKEEPWTKRALHTLKYRAAILGSLSERNLFRPSTRFVPTVLEAQIYRLTEEELNALMRAQVAESHHQQESLGFGYLCYGSEEEGTRKEVIKPVQPHLFVGRRTANFGKTGFGKSNENKVILTLMAHAFPHVGILILDQNAEYALQTEDTTSEGLVQAFKELGIKNRIYLYTAREDKWKDRFKKWSQDYESYVKVQSIKVDFYQFPELAIELAYYRRLLLEEKPPQYLESAFLNFEDWKRNHNRMAYVYGAFKEAGLEPLTGFEVRLGSDTFTLSSPQDWDNLRERLSDQSHQQRQQRNQGSDEKGARDLYKYAKSLSFLKKLHEAGRKDNFIESIKKHLFKETGEGEEMGKVIILDLPSLGYLADFLTQRLMMELFERAVELYGERQADFVVVIEEAHNLLKREAGIFYRVAKEGRKYGIGMLYSTQSPANIPMEILSQTENFLVKHLSSEEDIEALRKAKAAFAPVAPFLLSEPIVGYSYVYFEPYQPFVVPLRVKLLSEVLKELKTKDLTQQSQRADN